MLTVVIKYKRKHDADWQTVTLPYDAYFESDQDDPLNVDSVPIHDHAIDYLSDLPASEIQATKLDISDTDNNLSISITETFWNNFNNRVIERVDFGFQETYNEIIIQSRTQEEPVVTEVIRLVRQQGVLTAVYHGFISDNPDGSQSEHMVF